MWQLSRSAIWRMWIVAAVVLTAVAALSFAGAMLAKSKLKAAEPDLSDFVGPPQFPKINNHDQKLALLFGDSRIARWDPMPEFPGYQVVNRGIGGDTTARMLLRFERDVLVNKPALIIIQAGINDMVAAGLNPAAESRVKVNAINNLQIMVQSAERTGAKVILMSIIPPSNVGFIRKLFWSERIPELTEDVNLELETLARKSKRQLFDSASVLKHVDGRWKSDVNADELHLTRAGYQELNIGLQHHLQAGQ
jgi:lysophospholipase L1-like esterase